jgi:hypothetical protein
MKTLSLSGESNWKKKKKNLVRKQTALIKHETQACVLITWLNRLIRLVICSLWVHPNLLLQKIEFVKAFMQFSLVSNTMVGGVVFFFLIYLIVQEMEMQRKESFSNLYNFGMTARTWNS